MISSSWLSLRYSGNRSKTMKLHYVAVFIAFLSVSFSLLLPQKNLGSLTTLSKSRYSVHRCNSKTSICPLQMQSTSVHHTQNDDFKGKKVFRNGIVSSRNYYFLILIDDKTNVTLWLIYSMLEHFYWVGIKTKTPTRKEVPNSLFRNTTFMFY